MRQSTVNSPESMNVTLNAIGLGKEQYGSSFCSGKHFETKIQIFHVH